MVNQPGEIKRFRFRDDASLTAGREARGDVAGGWAYFAGAGALSMTSTVVDLSRSADILFGADLFLLVKVVFLVKVASDGTCARVIEN